MRKKKEDRETGSFGKAAEKTWANAQQHAPPKKKKEKGRGCAPASQMPINLKHAAGGRKLEGFLQHGEGMGKGGKPGKAKRFVSS